MPRVSMKMVLFLTLTSGTLAANMIDVIVDQMSDRCIASDLQFTATITDKNQSQAASLLLKKTGLVSQGVTSTDPKNPNASSKNIDLKIVNQLVGCEEKKIREARIRTYLKTVGIDSNTLAQGLFGHQPVFIIGASQKDSTLPQVWIDKATFLPVKEIGKNFTATFEKPSPVGAARKQFPHSITIAATENSVTISLANDPPQPKSSGG